MGALLFQPSYTIPLDTLVHDLSKPGSSGGNEVALESNEVQSKLAKYTIITILYVIKMNFKIV